VRARARAACPGTEAIELVSQALISSRLDSAALLEARARKLDLESESGGTSSVRVGSEATMSSCVNSSHPSRLLL